MRKTIIDLWKPHYGKNIDSQALCAIDLRSLPSLPASVRAARMKTSTARGAKMQKIIYLQCFLTAPPPYFDNKPALKVIDEGVKSRRDGDTSERDVRGEKKGRTRATVRQT